MPRLLILWFSIVWSSVWCSYQPQAFGYNTADARIFKGNDNQAYYYLAGSVYDMTADEWEHYPGGLAVLKKIGGVYNLNLIIKDHLTNSRAILQPGTDNCSGSITYEAQYDYYPYGKVLRKVENPRSRFQSTDHETDIETRYNNRNARWYDDESFQFLQLDPLSSIYPSLTPYNYVERNPISLIDPTGMYSEGESQEQYDAAKAKGFNPSAPYQMENGEYAFNTSYKDADGNYVVNTWHKQDFKPSIAEHIEKFTVRMSQGAPSWLCNMDEKGSWAHKGLGMIGDMAPNVSVVSLFTGKSSTGDDMHRGWAVLNLATLGNASKAKVAYQSHHLIPNQIFEKSAVQLSKMGWMQNHVKNLMKLPVPFHGNHPAYNKYMRSRVEYILKNGTLDDLIKLQDEMRTTIQGALDNGATNLNNYFKELVR